MNNDVYDVVDPATLDLIGQAPQHDQADVAQAAQAASKVARSWSSDRDARRALLREIARRVRAESARLGRILSLEQGKILSEATGEFLVGADLFDYYADLDWDEVSNLPERTGRSLEVHNLPVGLVGTITPWNFPISLLCVKLAPALAAGCTVVAKPSATTPLSTIALVELMNEILPSGVLCARTSHNRAVNVALASEPLVRKISFTGSIEVGTSLAASALESVKRVTLELGGNDPAFVLDDADVESTAEGIVRSAFRNSGQVCMAVKQVYVPCSLKSEFVEAVVAQAKQLTLGHGIDPATTMGPVHSSKQRDFVRGLVSDAVDSGARLASGEDSLPDLPGYFMPPTVVVDAQPGMGLVDDEQFGPALPIVEYDDLDAAIDHVNASEFGLGASVWSSDARRAHETALTIDAGTVWINQHTVVELDAPFGGQKASGVGRERGPWGLDEYLETRTINSRLPLT